MARDFTDEDRDKEVVTAGGDPVGIVHEVDGDRATVERAEGGDITDDTMDMLGWEDDDRTELQSEHVDSYEDDQIRLLGAQEYANLD